MYITMEVRKEGYIPYLVHLNPSTTTETEREPNYSEQDAPIMESHISLCNVDAYSYVRYLSQKAHWGLFLLLLSRKVIPY